MFDIPKHEEVAVILGVASQDAAERGGGYSGVINVLQGSGTCGAAVWLLVVFHVGSDGEESVGYAHMVLEIDPVEVFAEKPRRGVGDIGKE